MLVFLCFVIIILNPYTIIGPIGTALGIAIFAIIVVTRRAIMRPPEALIPVLAVTIWALSNGLLYGVQSPLTGLKVLGAVFVSLSAGFWLARLMGGLGLSVTFHTGLRWYVAAATLNGIIVILQVLFPQFKTATESILIQGQIVYTYRWRGIASQGGASLSLLHGIAIVIALELAARRLLTSVAAVGVALVNSLALLFIGRTGILIAASGIALFYLREVVVSRRVVATARALLVLIVAATVIGVAFQLFFSDYVSGGQIEYAIGFMLRGVDGFVEEGTAPTVLQYLMISPNHAIGYLIGEGYGLTSGFGARTDSGITRIILAVGVPMAFVYYASIYLLFRSWKGVETNFIRLLLTLFAVAEIKEPALLTGYASRGIFLCIGMSFAVAKLNECSNVNAARKPFEH